MGNYHKYTCPVCNKELDGIETDHHEERIETNETVKEWRVLYWCPDAHGVEEMYIEETLWFDFDGGEMCTQEIVFNKFVTPDM